MTSKKAPLLSIILIGYNSKRFLKHCLDGVMAQTFKQVETIFIDNDSHDDSVEFVTKKYPKVKVIANPVNTGYVGAANQGIKLSKAKYVMILNPDLIMTPTYLKHAIAKMEKDKKIGVITGKVLKYDFEKDKPTTKIDTTGLYCYRNRRVIDRGQGMDDTGQYDQAEEVFGISGAVPIYRREALEDTKLPTFMKGGHLNDGFEYLDEDFFMYKEDIDLSWRLRLRGWKCYYDPKALAHHGRGTGVLKRFSHWEVYKGRKNLSRFAKFYAYKNQRLMQIKNEQWGNVIRDFFPIVFKETLIFGYILVREPHLFKAVFKFFQQLPHALKKRKLIMGRAKVSSKKMHKWINGKARM
jgi:GT2 family glycosyltransferase